MAQFVYRSRVPAPVEAAFRWHERPGAFERLTPPWESVQVVRRSGGIRDGGRVHLVMRLGPFRVHWEALHGNYEANRQFTDEQIRGSFARWLHTHRFLPDGDEATILEDAIEYQPPLGTVGSALLGRLIRRRLARTFAWRHERTRLDLARQLPYARRPPMRIAISGASGLIGSDVRAFLSTAGHDVHSLVRRPPRSDQNEIFWNPARGSAVAETDLEGFDAIVHLAGENIASGRWTEARKQRIRESRVSGTRLLSEALASRDRKPRVLICASAVGYYGDRGDEPLDERAEPGEGFLAEVCREWEAATQPAVDAGIRVVNLRIGVVLSARGGALATMLAPFRLGLGGRIGSGCQHMSWIALDDLIGIVHFLLHADGVSGPVNAVAPQAVTNYEFTKTLGRVLWRPTMTPLPSAVVRVLLGEMGRELLLAGCCVIPAALDSAGFRFLFRDLESALRWELGRFEPGEVQALSALSDA